MKATSTDLLATLQGRVRAGTFLNEATSRYPAVVLGSVAAERLRIDRADGSVQVWLGGRWFTVVGILESLPLAPEVDRSALIGLPVARSVFGHDGSPSTVYVRTTPDHVDAVRAVLGRTANPQNPEEVRVSRPSAPWLPGPRRLRLHRHAAWPSGGCAAGGRRGQSPT